MLEKNKKNQVAQIILQAVDYIKLGKQNLARFLKGSESKKIASLSHKSIFGGLYWHNISTIENFIEQLEIIGFIERIQIQNYPYPISYYALTKAGKKALEEKIEKSLQEIKIQKPTTIGESEMTSLKMLRQGKTPTEIAKERNLADSTVHTHFYRLIVNGQLTSSEVIPKDVIDSIIEVRSKFEKQPSLKEIKELLPPEITYEQIRCVTAEFFREKVNAN